MSKPKKFRKLVKAAKMGKPYAMYQLGLCYELGRYVPQDLQTAASWIEDAAAAGYEAAQDWMSDYHFDDDARVQAHA